MFHEFSKLHSISIWMTMDLKTYLFIVEMRHLEELFIKKGV